MNANLIGIIISVTGLPFVVRGWLSFKVAFFSEHIALRDGCLAILTVAFGLWLISQGAYVAMHPKQAESKWATWIESKWVGAETGAAFLVGLPYYVRDNQACERLKAELHAAEERRPDKELAGVKEQERRAKANPQAPDDNAKLEADFENLYAKYHGPSEHEQHSSAWASEPSLTALESRPCCVSVADAIPAGQFSDRDAVDAAISRNWLCR
jgi:hypothetical protein